MDNDSRADRARRGLEAYLTVFGEDDRIGEDSDNDAWDEAIRDLIADLGHLYDREVAQFNRASGENEFEFSLVLDRAAGAFFAERSEEQPR